MKRFLFIWFLCLYSCDFFETKKVSSDAIVTEELKTINWNTVDKYPSFSECNTELDKEKQHQCFEGSIVKHVSSYLGNQHIVVSETLQDTIKLQLEITKQGAIRILKTVTRPETKERIPEMDSLLQGSISELPKIFPAIKRGQQVNTVFELPIAIAIE